MRSKKSTALGAVAGGKYIQESTVQPCLQTYPIRLDGQGYAETSDDLYIKRMGGVIQINR
ncbi:MAG: hypothetical protein U5J63_00040 [Fodinibius sp.]|nr:hypothetical protein [Fodinibius sp.]